MGFLLHNWPLKLGALLLATVLYVGFVLSLNVRVWAGTLPVDLVRQPTGATLLSDVDPVTTIRYRAPLDVFVSPTTFHATADLAGVEAQAGGPPVSVPVIVSATDSRVQVIGYEPDVVQVHLDPVETRVMDVDVSTGIVPDGLNLSTPQITPSTVEVRGASSRVAAIRSIVARVPIDASALNVDRDVDLQAIDEQGNPVPNVEMTPPRARVRIAVARELATRTLPVVPQLTGSVSAGLRLALVEVRPLSVTVSGEQSLVTQLQSAPTEPIDLTGRTRDFELDIALALPAGVTVNGASQVHVTVTLTEELASRTFQVGVTPTGRGSGLDYTLAATQVAVTLAGPTSELDAVTPAELVASVDVSGLATGTHSVPVAFEAPDGLELTAISPAEIDVIVSEPTGGLSSRLIAV
jgi:YbbR domain-containing protein